MGFTLLLTGSLNFRIGYEELFDNANRLKEMGDMK